VSLHPHQAAASVAFLLIGLATVAGHLFGWW
jgi:hypothetical protein